MKDAIERELVYFWYYFDIQLRQIFGYWVAGILIGSCISVFAKSWIHSAAELLGRRVPGLAGLALASALGIASPLCMYGTIPICAAFSKKGVKDDFLAAFMMGSILLNPQLIIYSTALGAQILAVRVAGCFLCGIAAGVLVRVFCKRAAKKRKAEFPSTSAGNAAPHIELAEMRGAENAASAADGQPEPPEPHYFDFSKFGEPRNRDTDANIFLRYAKNVWRNVRATGGWFLAGVALSALFQRYVPADFMARLFGGSKAWGVLMAATVGVPLYVCGGGTIPLLLDWLANGMSAGSAAAFMLTGPATKITNLGALKIALGAKHFALYLAFVAVFSLALGLAVNAILW